MKILYDFQIFSKQKFGGISRYFAEIMKGLSFSLPILVSDNFYLKNSNVKYLKLDWNFKGKIRLVSFINKIRAKLYFKFNDFDIFHPTYYDTYFLNYIKSKPFVLTIHDMTHEKFPEMIGGMDNVIENKKTLAKKASRIIAVSENTKKDIVEILKISPDKIDVIYHGSSFELIEECPDLKKKLVNRYILFTGKRNGYKNFLNFILAAKSVLNEQPDLFIICAGGGEFNDDELNSFKKYKINNQLINIQCNDKELKTLYVNSLFFIFPSIYEGFGIPLLEAMSCRTPILCSNSSCFPEIAENCAVFFNPVDVTDIEKKIRSSLDSDLSEIVYNGVQKLSFFSWKKAQIQTKKVYEKIKL